MNAVLSQKRVLVVGAGGLGCPAATALAQSGVGHLAIADDDQIDESNLHRQTLFGAADVGGSKAQVAAKRLKSEAAHAGHNSATVAREIRVLPDSALDIVAGYDLVLEGADNFATKFLVADACAIAGVPVVQAGAVRWSGWCLGSIPDRTACLRCVFEGVPTGQQDTCAEAGVIGPVVGVIGALQAAVSLRLLLGDESAAGVLWSYRGLAGVLRQRPVSRQTQCALCNKLIRDTDVSRYVPPECAA